MGQDLFDKTKVGEECFSRGYCIMRTFEPHGNRCQDCGASYDGPRASVQLRKEGSAILRGAVRRELAGAGR